MTNPRTSVVYTNRHLLLPKSLGASADLDRLGWPWPGSSFSAVSCGLRGQCQLSYGSPHLPGCQAGLVLRATAGSPQRAEVCEGLWSPVWELVVSLPPFIITRQVLKAVRKSGHSGSQPCIQDPRWGERGGLETRGHFCDPPTEEV